MGTALTSEHGVKPSIRRCLLITAFMYCIQDGQLLPLTRCMYEHGCLLFAYEFLHRKVFVRIEHGMLKDSPHRSGGFARSASISLAG